MIRVNVSEILDFQTCPSYWASRWVYRRAAARPPSRALTVGTAAHAAWASALVSPPDTWDGFIVDRLAPDDIEGRRDARHLEWWSERVWEEHPWDEVVGTEVRLEAEVMPGVTLFGRVDAVVKVRGLYRPLQWKTVSSSTSLPVFSASVQHSLHEAAYQRLMRENYSPIGGTLLVAVRKLSHHEIAKGEECVVCGQKGYKVRREGGWWWVDMPISEQRMQKAMEGVGWVGWQMWKLRDRLEHMPLELPLPTEQRTRACAGYHGNRLCEYLPTCAGELGLDDNLAYQDTDPLSSYKEDTSDA